MKDKKKKNIQDDKRTDTLRIISVASIIMAIVIVFVGNVLFDGIFGDKLTFDLTSTSQNSITEETKAMIDSLPSDMRIRIVGLFERPVNIKGNYFEYVVPLLDDYQAESGGRISVEYIDPQIYPSIIAELDPTGTNDLKQYIYVVKCGDKLTTVDPNDCYTYDQELLQYNYSLPLTNIAESTFSNAIRTVTTANTKKAYFVSGLLNSDEHVQLSSILYGMGIDSEDLPASDDFTVPSDCDILFIAGINIDITERMAVEIGNYLDRGGKVIVAVNYLDNSNIDYVNLNTLLARLNLQLGNILIKENDRDYMVAVNGYQSFVHLSPEFGAQESGTSMIMSNMRPVTEAGTPYANIRTMDILTTSSRATSSYYDPEAAAVISGSDEQCFSVAKYATIDGVDNAPELFVFGTTDITSDDFIGRYGSNFSNVAFLRGIIRRSVGVDDNLQFVASKPLSDYSIEYSNVTATTVNILTICLLFVIPLTLVICGVVIYRKRKNL